MSNLVGSEEHVPLLSKKPWPYASWEAGMIWQQLMQTFSRPRGKTFSHTKIPVGCFILKLLPCAAEKLIWEKWPDDKVWKIWLNGLNFIFNN